MRLSRISWLPARRRWPRCRARGHSDAAERFFFSAEWRTLSLWSVPRADRRSRRELCRTHIIDEMPDDLQRVINQSSSDQKELRRIVEGICADAIKDNPFAIPLGDRERLVEELISEILGLGPIEPLLKDSSVTEVMVNGPDSIYIERKCRLQKTDVRFRNTEHLMHIIDRIVTAVGRRVDESSPMVDARLADEIGRASCRERV